MTESEQVRKQIRLELERDSAEGDVGSLEEYLGRWPERGDLVREEYSCFAASTFMASAVTEEVGYGAALAAGFGERRQIGPYVVGKRLGAGGQASVYRAEDTRLRNRRVALKVLKDFGVHTGLLLKRFQREAEVAASLDHPAICPVLEAGSDDGVFWIAMKLVEGRTLAEVIRERQERDDDHAVSVMTLFDEADHVEPSSRSTTKGTHSKPGEIQQLVRYFEEVADALHVAHEAGIVHRDVKPGNLMVTPGGHPVILDFGLAQAEDGGVTITGEGDVMGTPSYMSPEQVSGHRGRVDRRTDIYSVGVTLYECLAGRRPFVGATRHELFDHILHRPEEPVNRVNSAVDPNLALVVGRAMAKDRDSRYETAAALSEDLRRWREDRPVLARPIPWWVQARLWMRRHRLVATASAMFVTALALGLTIALLALTRERAALKREQSALASKDRALGQASDALESERRVTRLYEQMSDASLVARLLREEDLLWPRRAEKIPAMDAWLERARRALLNRESHRAERDRLRAEAGPYSNEALSADTPLREVLHRDHFERLTKLKDEINERRVELARVVLGVDLLERRLLSVAPEELPRVEAELDQEKRNHEEILDLVEQRIAEYELLRESERTRERMTLGINDERKEWRHEVLTRLLVDMERLEVAITLVSERRRMAEEIEEQSLTAASVMWSRALQDIVESPRYGESDQLQALGVSEFFATMTPQVGLVPLGKNDATGLWEFWCVESGPRPPWLWTDEPHLLGRVELPKSSEGDYGIVMVLLPGGHALLGAENDPNCAQFDPNARGDEGSVFEVALAPFFLSKYETTQGQWMRVFDRNPSYYQPGSVLGMQVSMRQPVEQTSWFNANEAARRLGLELPTEAQWEYGARGGTTTPWWCGSTVASIFERRAGNLADESYKAAQGTERHEVGFTDGFPVHAPVGTFAENGYGLHDVIGNVWEWCADGYGAYDLPVASDTGLRQGTIMRLRCYRGGCFYDHAFYARSSLRYSGSPDAHDAGIGFRLARSLQP